MFSNLRLVEASEAENQGSGDALAERPTLLRRHHGKGWTSVSLQVPEYAAAYMACKHMKGLILRVCMRLLVAS